MDKPAPPVLTGVRKRQQIESTNKNIFVWLAVASVIVSFCLVALQFLVREFLFNQKIINAKSETNQRLVDNVAAGKELTKNVNALIANTNLNAVRTDQSDETSNLSVVLDALPITGDATGFANSLQTVVLPRSGVAIRELSTNSVDTSAEDAESASVGSVNVQPLALPFKAGFKGQYAAVQKALVDMAHVIRPISLTELVIRSDEAGIIQVTIGGETYYLPARSVEVRMETLKP